MRIRTIPTILMLMASVAMFAQVNRELTDEYKKEVRQKLALDYAMPDYSVKKIDERKMGSHLANILRYFEENGTRGTLVSWIGPILSEQNESFKNRYIELKKLKLQKVSKTVNEMTIIYNATLQGSADLPSQADMTFHFMDGVSESKPVNDMFSYISRYVTAREQLNK